MEDLSSYVTTRVSTQIALKCVFKEEELKAVVVSFKLKRNTEALFLLALLMMADYDPFPAKGDPLRLLLSLIFSFIIIMMMMTINYLFFFAELCCVLSYCVPFF